MSDEKIMAQQRGDQAWATMRQYFVDIDRIADDGCDGSEKDVEIVRKMAQLIRGEITLRILEGEGKE